MVLLHFDTPKVKIGDQFQEYIVTRFGAFNVVEVNPEDVSDVIFAVFMRHPHLALVQYNMPTFIGLVFV